MKTQVIIPAAGHGERMNSAIPKPLLEIQGKPIIIYTLEVFEESSSIDSIILVTRADQMGEFEKYIQKFHLTKISKIVAGGETRYESVLNGTRVLDKDTDIVVIHDGVRPLVTKQMIDEAIESCQINEAVVAAIPIKPTIKKVDQNTLLVEKTLDRRELWEIQTPQVFRKEILQKAYEQNTDNESTDDATLVEQLGIDVKVFRGDYKNIKVTTQEDLTVAEAFLNLIHQETGG